MIQHIIAFSLYTFAMIGIFFIAFIVYKKTMNINGPKLNNGMKIEDMLRLSQRKTIYIINVQGERFLIASDLENTTFLAKLDNKNTSSAISSQITNKARDNNSERIEKYIKELETTNGTANTVENYTDDYSNAVDLKSKSAIMKNILKELENNSKRTSI